MLLQVTMSPAFANHVCNGASGQHGTSGNDNKTLTGYPDVYSGLGGNDIIDGRGDYDFLCGGDGADSILGGFSGAGTNYDSINGGPGGDTILGQEGNDFIYGDDGFDYLYGDNETAFSGAMVGVTNSTGVGMKTRWWVAREMISCMARTLTTATSGTKELITVGAGPAATSFTHVRR